MPQQHFIIEGKFLGAVERRFQKKSWSPVHVPLGYAFFCPTCGEVWALCPVIGPGGQASRFEVQTRACRKHPAQPFTTEPPGILHLSWDKEFSDSFPDDVVRWEFDRYMEFL